MFLPNNGALIFIDILNLSTYLDYVLHWKAMQTKHS